MVYYQAWTRSYISTGARCVVTNWLSLAGCGDALKIIMILSLLLVGNIPDMDVSRGGTMIQNTTS
jgi:hypothetical protein